MEMGMATPCPASGYSGVGVPGELLTPRKAARLPRPEHCGGLWQNAADPASSGFHSRIRARPPTADNRLGSERRATSANRGSTSVALQVEIGCSSSAFKHKDGAILRTITHAESRGKGACRKL